MLTKDILVIYLKDLEVIQKKYNDDLPEDYNDYPTFDNFMYNFYKNLIEETKLDIINIENGE